MTEMARSWTKWKDGSLHLDGYPISMYLIRKYAGLAQPMPHSIELRYDGELVSKHTSLADARAAANTLADLLDAFAPPVD